MHIAPTETSALSLKATTLDPPVQQGRGLPPASTSAQGSLQPLSFECEFSSSQQLPLSITPESTLLSSELSTSANLQPIHLMDPFPCETSTIQLQISPLKHDLAPGDYYFLDQYLSFSEHDSNSSLE